MTSRIIIFAPNLHTGGGLVVLQDLISSIPKNVSCKYYLDIRSKKLNIHYAADVVWVKPSFFSRFKSELGLFLSSTNDDAILFLHSLPPIFNVKGRKILYLHNKLLLNKHFFYTRVNPKTAIRVFFERFLLRFFISSVDEVFVQTSSIRTLFLARFPSKKLEISVIPFFTPSKLYCKLNLENKFDLIYIASSDYHKNHINLFEALKLLKEEGFNFSLAVTVSPGDKKISKLISYYNNNYSLNITNLGTVSHSSVFDFYRTASALIFPSIEESFGLPLVEAKYLNLPIIASELDYVRDVCCPHETFNPFSSLSISRAIKRFFSVDQGGNTVILDGPTFVKEFLQRVNYCE